MIRAVVQNGLIRPVDPLPIEWAEGRIVVVEDAESGMSDDLDEWYRELNRLSPPDMNPASENKFGPC
jgi:hypothetical protein